MIGYQDEPLGVDEVNGEMLVPISVGLNRALTRNVTHYRRTTLQQNKLNTTNVSAVVPVTDDQTVRDHSFDCSALAFGESRGSNRLGARHARQTLRRDVKRQSE